MWYLILSLIIAIYLAINLVLPRILTSSQAIYIAQPIIWIILAIITFIIAKHEGLDILKYKKIRRWQLGKEPYHTAILLGGFHIAILVIAGLFFGFGENPNMINTQTFFIFLLYITTPVIGMEITRTYLIKKSTPYKKNITLMIAIIALFYMAIQIKTTEILTLNLSDPTILLEFIGKNIIPLFAVSLFASYLAYYGGAIAPISYLLIVKGFQTYSPLLPDLEWVFKAFIQVIVPTIGFLLIQSSIQDINLPSKIGRRISKRKDPTLGWLAIAVVALLIILFSFGYFGAKPTIISSGSMQPALEKGDMVLIEHVQLEDIGEGDIIQYKMGNIPTVHRVYDIQTKENGEILFITQGDANNEPDVEPVKPEQIQGKVVFNIPKIGWIPLSLKILANRLGLPI